MSTTVPVQVLSLRMIIMTRKSWKVIENPGATLPNGLELVRWYSSSTSTGWSSAKRPSFTPFRAAIMMAILRVLAE